MEIKTTFSNVMQELSQIISTVDEQEMLVFANEINTSKRIFVTGAGRSLLMIKCFAMRLMQTGHTAFVVGETTTPAIKEDDLLVVASGSGETKTLEIVARSAKNSGAKIMLITANENSTLGKISDNYVLISAQKKDDISANEVRSVQPGASSFEQSVLLVCDTIIACLGSDTTVSEQNKRLMGLHANLE